MSCLGGGEPWSDGTCFSDGTGWLDALLPALLSGTAQAAAAIAAGALQAVASLSGSPAASPPTASGAITVSSPARRRIVGMLLNVGRLMQ